MSFTEKIDTLDLLINILADHEKKLDNLVSRFERIAPQTSIDIPCNLTQMEAQ